MRDVSTVTEPASTRLSRAAIIEACVRLGDTGGPSALTMRRLGAELGVDPTAVYRHFRDKDEMLAATADRLLAEALDGFTTTADVRADLRRLYLAARAVYLAHPLMAQLMATPPAPLASEFRFDEVAMGLLRSSGLPDEQAALIFEALEGYTAGSATLEAAYPRETDATWRRSFIALGDEDFPHLTATAPLLYRDRDTAFAHGLDLLIAAVPRRRKGTRSTT